MLFFFCILGRNQESLFICSCRDLSHAKGLLCSKGPTCTLSQNGYGACNEAALLEYMRGRKGCSARRNVDALRAASVRLHEHADPARHSCAWQPSGASAAGPALPSSPEAMVPAKYLAAQSLTFALFAVYLFTTATMAPTLDAGPPPGQEPLVGALPALQRSLSTKTL